MSERYDVSGRPGVGLWAATLGFAAGLTSIVFYGVAGPEFKESLGLSGALLGLLLASPHLSKALLRIPFGAWVDKAGGRTPMLILLCSTVAGMAGLVGLLVLYYPDGFGMDLFPFLLIFGFMAGAGGATFSVGIPQASYWFPADRQGYVLGVYAGAGNISPGVFNYIIPLSIGFWGLTGAYVAWLVFMIAATVIYAMVAVDAYYFQLVEKGLDRERAKRVSRELGQEVFPSGSTWKSLKNSAANSRTWVLVFLYFVSFGGGFTALTAWFPTYWALFHDVSLLSAGLIAAIFTVYGSLIRIPGGSLSDRYGGENMAILSFMTMLAGSAILAVSSSFVPAFIGMMILGTGMGGANAAVFELVPLYIPEYVGGASGWIGGIGGAGTLVIIPALGVFVDSFGSVGYARGFVLFVLLSGVCAGVSYALKKSRPVVRK